MPLSRISAILMQVSASILVGFGLLLSQSLWAAPDVFREMTADVLNPSYRYAIQKGSAQERAMVFAIASVAGYFLPQEIAHLPTGSHIWPDYFLRADGKNDPIVKETM